MKLHLSKINNEFIHHLWSLHHINTLFSTIRVLTAQSIAASLLLLLLQNAKLPSLFIENNDELFGL